MRNDILVAEISGKRPGGVNKRPTEKFKIGFDHVIISNNSDGYETEWDIIHVPDDFRQDYIDKYKTSDTAWYAPMNRSYAIKYAKEKGYKYLIQLDDNIKFLEVKYELKEDEDGIRVKYSSRSTTEMMDEFIKMIVSVLENTNAGMAGCSMAACYVPGEEFLRERYCYSLFGLDLSVCPDFFQGDFEDDIEFRLKLGQMGIPAIQIVPLRYSKTGQVSNKDETGNRAAYTAAGVKRGEHMSTLYGDKYSCGMRSRTIGLQSRTQPGKAFFKHTLSTWKVGCRVKDWKKIEKTMADLLRNCATVKKDSYYEKVRKIR